MLLRKSYQLEEARIVAGDEVLKQKFSHAMTLQEKYGKNETLKGGFTPKLFSMICPFH